MFSYFDLSRLSSKQGVWMYLNVYVKMHMTTMITQKINEIYVKFSRAAQIETIPKQTVLDKRHIRLYCF